MIKNKSNTKIDIYHLRFWEMYCNSVGFLLFCCFRRITNIPLVLMALHQTLSLSLNVGILLGLTLSHLN